MLFPLVGQSGMYCSFDEMLSLFRSGHFARWNWLKRSVGIAFFLSLGGSSRFTSSPLLSLGVSFPEVATFSTTVGWIVGGVSRRITFLWLGLWLIDEISYLVLFGREWLGCFFAARVYLTAIGLGFTSFFVFRWCFVVPLSQFVAWFCLRLGFYSIYLDYTMTWYNCLAYSGFWWRIWWVARDSFIVDSCWSILLRGSFVGSD